MKQSCKNIVHIRCSALQKIAHAPRQSRQLSDWVEAELSHSTSIATTLSITTNPRSRLFPKSFIGFRPEPYDEGSPRSPSMRTPDLPLPSLFLGLRYSLRRPWIISSLNISCRSGNRKLLKVAELLGEHREMLR